MSARPASPDPSPPLTRRDGLRRLVGLGVVLVPPGALLGCSRGSEPGEWYSNWDLAGGCQAAQPGAPWLNAAGEPSGFCPGDDPTLPSTADWTWVFYGAPWCSTSTRQAARMPDFVSRVGSQALVYTVLTAPDGPNAVPQLADVRAWGARTGLPPHRVLFNPRESDNRTVPQHLLIGPDARTWWRFAGGLPVDMMVEVLAEFAAGRRQPRVRRIKP